MRRSLSLLAAAALVVTLGAPAYAGNARDPAEDKQITAMRDKDGRHGRHHHRGDGYRHHRRHRDHDGYRHHRYHRHGYYRYGYHRHGGYYGYPYYSGYHRYYDDPYYRDCYSGPGSWR